MIYQRGFSASFDVFHKRDFIFINKNLCLQTSSTFLNLQQRCKIKTSNLQKEILIFCKQPLKASYASFIPLVFKEKGKIRIFTLYPCDTKNDKNGH